MWYHGTNQIIEAFKIDDAIQGIATSSVFTKGLIYFTEDPNLAGDYAENARNNIYSGDHNSKVKHGDELVKRYHELEDKGNYEESEAVYLEIERHEDEIKNDCSGDVIYPVNLSIKKGLTPKIKTINAGGVTFSSSWANQIIKKARNEGSDAIVIANVIDKPIGSRKHSPKCIAIVLNEDIITSSISPERDISDEIIVSHEEITAMYQAERDAFLASQ